MRYSYDQKFFSYFRELERRFYAMPVRLGGSMTSISGSWGGTYLGYVGYLPQDRVGYDADELASDGFLYSGVSLVDNLNHIRFRLDELETNNNDLSVYSDDILVDNDVTIINFGTNLEVVDNGNGDVTINAVISGLSYAETIGDGLEIYYTVNHNLSSEDLIIQLWDLTGTYPLLATTDADAIEILDNDNVYITFSGAPDVDSYRVVILVRGGGDATTSGVSAFIDLTDTPNSYTGEANKYAQVKDDETGLEFSSITLNEISDVNTTGKVDTSFLVYDFDTSTWIAWKPSVSNNVIMYWNGTEWSTALVNTLFDASDVSVDTSTFDGILSAADDTVQKALDTIDDVIMASGSSGSVYFVDLLDVPASYVGESLRSVRVNVDETGLEFYDPSDFGAWYQTIYVDKYGNGDYTTVKEACDYVSTQTRTDPWVIWIAPGEYEEDPFTIPSNTHLMGSTQPAYITRAPIKIRFSATSGIMITMNSNTAIDYIELYWDYVVLTGAAYLIKTNGSGYCTLRTCTIGLEPETASTTDQVTAFWASAASSVLFLYNVDIDDRLTVPTANTETSLFRSQNSTNIEIRNTTVQVQTNNHYTGILYDGDIEIWNSFIGDRYDNRGTGTVQIYGQYGVNHYGYDVDSPAGFSSVEWLGDTNSTLIRGKPITTDVPADNQILVYSTATGEWELGTNAAGATTLGDLSDVVLFAMGDNQVLRFEVDIAAWTNSTLDASYVAFSPTVVADWDGDTDPGDLDDAINQLAERITDLEESGAAGGDMLKATYDTDNDGIVDAAETVPWSGVSDKPSMQALFTVEGDLTTGAKALRLPNRTGRDLTISEVYLTVGTVPTGASIIVDIHEDGTTIFTDQNNRPVILATANEGTTTTIDIDTWSNGSYLTMEVDQKGSTIAGANLTVVIVYV